MYYYTWLLLSLFLFSIFSLLRAYFLIASIFLSSIILVFANSGIRMSTIIVSSLSESWYFSLPGGGLFAGGFAVGFAVGFALGKSTISGTAGRRVFEGMTS